MVIDCVVDKLYPVCVLLYELEKVFRLRRLINDAVDDPKGLEVQFATF